MRREAFSVHVPAVFLAVGMAISGASPARAADWTGAYVGAGLGADAVTGEIDAVLAGTGSLSAEGLGGGDIGVSLRAGADYQLNKWLVVGAFANLDWSNIETSGSMTGLGESVAAEILKLKHAWTIGARAGVLMTPAFLAYGLLGYTHVAFDDPSVRSVTTGASARLDLPSYYGVVLGGGFEHRLSSRVSLTGEYRQARFDKEVLFEDPGNAIVRGAPTLHVGRVGVAWRFGGARDEAEATSAPEVGKAWNGFYVGAGLGVDAMTRDLTLDAPGVGVSGRLEGLGGGDVGGTVIAGYDHRMGPRLVLGLYGLLDWSSQTTEVSASAFGQTASADLLALDRSWTIGARAGMLLASDVLGYVLAGYTHTEFSDARLSATGQSVTLRFPSFKGLTIGGGFEKLISHNLSLRAEYRYTALGDEELAAVPGVATLKMDPSLHTGRLLLSYRFPTGG